MKYFWILWISILSFGCSEADQSCSMGLPWGHTLCQNFLDAYSIEYDTEALEDNDEATPWRYAEDRHVDSFFPFCLGENLYDCEWIPDRCLPGNSRTIKQMQCSEFIPSMQCPCYHCPIEKACKATMEEYLERYPDCPLECKPLDDPYCCNEGWGLYKDGQQLKDKWHIVNLCRWD